MKRTYSFVTAREFVDCVIDGQTIALPILVGVLKHPTETQLRQLLREPSVARKYTRAALAKLPWSALRQFPHDWLHVCLVDSDLPPGRRMAIEYMLAPGPTALPAMHL